MRSQFTDIYAFVGLDPELEQTEIRREIDRILKESENMNKKGSITDKQFKAVKSACKILKDPSRKSKYDSLGHEKYVELEDTFLKEVDFIGGKNTYENFYDLFGLDRDADKKEIDKKTAIKIKKSHPDNTGDGDPVNPERFETLKTARNVLTKPRNRRKYDNMGHKEYVKNEIDSELRGYRFTSNGSIISQNKIGGEHDIESLISFRSSGSMTESTENIVETRQERESNEEESESNDEKETRYGAKPEDKREDNVKINILVKSLVLLRTSFAKISVLLIISSSVGLIMNAVLGFGSGLAGFVLVAAIGSALILKK
jgi:DnaJ-class molecular chaperone